mgnify:CR=1 FL=1
MSVFFTESDMRLPIFPEFFIIPWVLIWLLPPYSSSIIKGSNIEKFVEKPDFETRLDILNHKIDNDKIKISKDIVDYIALQVDTNVRELEGVLISLLAHSTIIKKEIDLELTKSVINKIVKNNKKKININYIQEIVSKFFNISIEQMKDKARKKEIERFWSKAFIIIQ